MPNNVLCKSLAITCEDFLKGNSQKAKAERLALTTLFSKIATRCTMFACVLSKQLRANASRAESKRVQELVFNWL